MPKAQLKDWRRVITSTLVTCSETGSPDLYRVLPGKEMLSAQGKELLHRIFYREFFET